MSTPEKKAGRTRKLAQRAGIVGLLAGAGILGPSLPASAAPTSTWDSVAECKSSGDWSINIGNGYYGRLQFLRIGRLHGVDRIQCVTRPGSRRDQRCGNRFGSAFELARQPTG